MTVSKVKQRKSRLQDLVGNQFGRLVVESRAANSSRGQARWNCRCECGNEKAVRAGHLKSGKIVSCGCFISELTTAKNTTHGLSYSSEHKIWLGIKARCLRPTEPGYPYYGGRGITICDRWRESFEAFYADMGPRPSLDHSIDRVDSNGNYEPGNCRWATKLVQIRNRSVVRRFTVGDITQTLSEWSEASGIPRMTLACRIERGLTMEQAIASGLSRQQQRKAPVEMGVKA